MLKEIIQLFSDSMRHCAEADGFILIVRHPDGTESAYIEGTDDFSKDPQVLALKENMGTGKTWRRKRLDDVN